MIKSIIKKCGCCGKLFESIPKNCIHEKNNDEFDGYWWHCDCGETLFIPTKMEGSGFSAIWDSFIGKLEAIRKTHD